MQKTLFTVKIIFFLNIMDLKDNINHYGYTWKSMDKNIDSIKSIKASKFKNLYLII